jgi:hypothetical protein
MILFCCEGVSRLSGWFSKETLPSGEGVPLPSGEDVQLPSGEGVPLPSGEGVQLPSGEGVPLPSGEGAPRATSPEWYMDRAAKCMDQVQRMSSESNSTNLRLYHRQCEYLARQLETAIRDSRESFDRSFPPDRNADQAWSEMSSWPAFSWKD